MNDIINTAECPDDLDITIFVEHVDPDWTDHFQTVDIAFAHYWTYLDPLERNEAMTEARPIPSLLLNQAE